LISSVVNRFWIEDHDAVAIQNPKSKKDPSMTRISTRGSIALAVVFLIPCWGCGNSVGGPQPTLLAVKGKVTYKGQPVTKGIVRFEPDGYGRMASGELQSDGTFVLATLKPGDGVVAGEHQVTIDGFDKSLAKDRALRKYGGRNTSGLTAAVSPEKTEFTFDLK